MVSERSERYTKEIVWRVMRPCSRDLLAALPSPPQTLSRTQRPILLMNAAAGSVFTMVSGIQQTDNYSSAARLKDTYQLHPYSPDGSFDNVMRSRAVLSWLSPIDSSLYVG